MNDQILLLKRERLAASIEKARRLEEELCRESLREFTKRAWPIIEGGRQLSWNWHHDLICAELEKVARGDNDRLIINIPPGTMKSLLVNVMLPAWWWIRDPSHRFMNVSTGADLAKRDSGKARRIIESDWYQDTFVRGKWKLMDDQNAVIWYDSSAGGHRQAIGIESRVTGKGCDCVTGNMLITTDRGRIPMWDIVAMADKPRVLSLNEETGDLEYKRIVATKISGPRPVVDVLTASGRNLRCTPDHRVRVYGGYQPASETLGAQASIETCGWNDPEPSLGLDPVVAVSAVEGDLPVYDIQVEGNHNFFANGVLVHNCLIVDDPIGAKEAKSPTQLASVNTNFDTDMPSRIRDQRNGAIIIIMQRLNMDDLCGHMLKTKASENWTHLCLPMEFEPDHPHRYPGDPRKKRGELLWPDFMPEWVVTRLKNNYSTYDWAGQYQQRPAPEGGGIIKRDWFMKWTKGSVKCEYVLQSWDLAAEAGDHNDYSALTTWGVFRPEPNGPHAIILLDGWKDHLEFPELQRTIRDAYEWRILHHKGDDQPKRSYEVDGVMVERKSAGHSMLQAIKRLGIPAIPFNPKSDSKVQRAHAITPYLEAGMVYVPYTPDGSRPLPFVELLLTECDYFPRGKNDDMVDTMTQALATLRNRLLVAHPAEPEYEQDDPVQRKAVYG